MSVEMEQTEAEALASMMAGYDNARGEEPPAEVVNDPSPTEEVIVEETPEEPAPEPAPDVASLAEELKSLKARVSASTSEPDAVRKLHGEIGNINRTLKQLQSVKDTAPADPDLTAAMQKAEDVAKEFPELAGPIVELMKASIVKHNAKQEPIDIDQRINSAVTEIRQREALETLTEDHPDWETVRDTPEYKTWLATKTPEFQERFTTTWNPAVVSKGLSEFKDSLKSKERKQTRLAAAVAPQGEALKAKPSTLSDEEALYRGYNSGPKRRIN